MCDCCVLSSDFFVPAYQRWDDHPATRDWEPLQDLGNGAFSQVVLARHRTTGAIAALKVVFYDNPEVDADTEKMLAQEGELLLILSHPNVVSCTEVIKSPRADVLVLEYLRGGNVLDGLYRLSHTYTERDAWGIFSQLAAAVAYLHSCNVIHRDIKPENLVYAKQLPRPIGFPPQTQTPKKGAAAIDAVVDAAKQKEEEEAAASLPPPVVKVVDLGMAWKYDPYGVPDKGVLGSAGFVAPEIVQGGAHTPAMDVFSMGVLLFIMLVGRKPFNIDDSEKLRYAKMGLSAAPGLKDPRWLDLSPDAKHLLMGMLAYDPHRRLTSEQVMQHEWVMSRGGRVLRLLGMDVALGAATVAEMRRLRFLCNGVVALRRVATTVEAETKQKRRAAVASGAGEHEQNASCREHDVYLNELKRMQRREASVRNGGRGSLRGAARSITSASYKYLHDTGGSVHRSALARQAIGGDSQNGGGGGGGTAAATTGGMRRSGTALLLSEVLAPDPDSTAHNAASNNNNNTGGTSNGMRRSKSVSVSGGSGFQLLGASFRHFVDVSVHGAKPSSRSDVKMSAASKCESSLDAAVDIVPPPDGAADGDYTRIIRVRSSNEFVRLEKKQHGVATTTTTTSTTTSAATAPPLTSTTSTTTTTNTTTTNTTNTTTNNNTGSKRRVHSVKPLN